MLDTTQAARELGISPRQLRRFMRSHPTFATVGMGGRYTFSQDDIETIRASLPTKKPKDPPELAWLDQTPGFTLAEVRDPRMRREVLEQRRERQRRLNERLKELSREGVVSQ